ncbi:hypothetical protein CTI32_06465 [Enterococcus faecium]|nr:hypothetical protein CTI32_06465 [Enterococcus faecium]
MCCGNSILQKGLPFFYLHKIFYTLFDSLNKNNKMWNGNSFFDKFYKVQNFFPYAIPIVLDNEPPRM